MARVEFAGLSKQYENGAVGLARVDLRIESGEFIVLVGPSGCGKSTLLRCLAGLEQPSTGQVLIEGHDVTQAPPASRGVGMVFQDYALYPHMNVRQNLAFGLKLRGMKAGEIEPRIGEMSAMLGLGELLDRKPAQLSGGQRQRVAIGRALIRRPEVLLLDEPLSNLDAQLRARTRVEIASLHRRVGGTALYVTHDQEEAMTLADRIVVLQRGTIQQVGTPAQIYREPVNRFVASFMGTPSMNFLEGVLRARGERWSFVHENAEIELTGAVRPAREGRYVLGFRPEAVRIGAGLGSGAFHATVTWVELHGHEVHVIARRGEAAVTVRVSDPEGLARARELKAEMPLGLSLNTKELHWFVATEEGERVRELVNSASGQAA